MKMTEQTYQNRPLDYRQMKVIRRQDIKGIVEMNVEGVNTFLGEVRNFKNHPYLEANLPKDLSISWTKMPNERELPAHFHPCASTIIVTRGEGRSSGDTEAPIFEGDVVYIPEWNLHGFAGKGSSGFEALSIQFQPTAIFESADAPQTTYQERAKIPLKDRQLKVIERDSLRELNQVSVANKVKNIGRVKNFSGDSLLDQKFPKNFSAAWVYLGEGEQLDQHTHTTDSMIIVTNGRGQVFGDLSQKIETGDLVYVPAGCHHGFRGSPDNGEGGGFWALSIQFTEESLYQNSENPRVEFVSEFDRFVKENETLAESFKSNPIFQLSSENLRQNPVLKRRLLDGLQVMSSHFQRLMFARMALCSSNRYRSLFFEHMMEELGHDTELADERGQSKTIWDPVLESAAAWFVGKNYLLDDAGRVVMVQMVLEKGASLFYSHFAQIFSGELNSTHISKHCEADEGHDSMGVDLLAHESSQKLQDLGELRKQSWSMLYLFLERLSEYVLFNECEANSLNYQAVCADKQP